MSEKTAVRFIEVEGKGVCVQVNTEAGFYTVGGETPFYYCDSEAAKEDAPRHIRNWIVKANEWASTRHLVGGFFTVDRFNLVNEMWRIR